MISKKTLARATSREVRSKSEASVNNKLQKSDPSEKDIKLAPDLVHKDNVNWTPLFITFIASCGLLVACFILSNERFFTNFGILVLFTLVASLIQGLYIYYRSEENESLDHLFLVHLASGLLTVILTIIFFNLLVFGVYLSGFSVSTLILGVFVLLCTFFFFLVLFLNLEIISKHFFGYFDYNSYFVFRHFPFTLLNADYRRKWTLLKYPIITLVGIFILLGVLIQIDLSQSNENHNSAIWSVRRSLNQQLQEECFQKILAKANLTGAEFENHPVIFANGYAEYEDFEADIIYSNCNLETFECEQKSFDTVRPINEQIYLPIGLSDIKIVKTTEGAVLISPHNFSTEQLLSCTPFSESQSNLEIIQEVEKQRRALFGDIFTWQPQPGLNAYLSSSPILDLTQFGLQLGRFRMQVRALNLEWGYLQSETFYDGSDNINDHLLILRDNVDVLNEQYRRLPKWGEMNLGGYDYYDSWNFIDFEGSYNYLLSRWTISKKLDQELMRLVNDNSMDVLSLVKSLDANESPESKAIRLKIVETLLAQQLGQACQRINEPCREFIINLTKTPELMER